MSPTGAVAHQHVALEDALPDASTAPGRNAEQHEVGAAREHGDAEVVHRSAHPLAFRDHAADPVVHLVDVLQGQTTGELLGRVEVVGQRDLLQLGDHPRRADDITEPGGGHPPRLGERAHHCHGRIVAHPVERGPRRELCVCLVDDDEPGSDIDQPIDHVPEARPAQSGCSASRGTPPTGRPRRSRGASPPRRV